MVNKHKMTTSKRGFTPLEVIPQGGMPPKAFGGLLTGFTLLELIISSILIVLIFLAIYTAFSSGLRLWARTNQTVLNKEQVIITLDRLAKELRSHISFALINFEEKENSLSFPLLVRPKGEEQTADFYLPAKVTYSFDEEEETINRQSLVYGKDKEPSTRELATAIKSLKFYYRYYDEESEEWFWDEECRDDTKPTAVKVEIITKSVKDETEETITRVITLPTQVY